MQKKIIVINLLLYNTRNIRKNTFSFPIFRLHHSPLSFLTLIFPNKSFIYLLLVVGILFLATCSWGTLFYLFYTRNDFSYSPYTNDDDNTIILKIFWHTTVYIYYRKTFNVNIFCIPTYNKNREEKITFFSLFHTQLVFYCHNCLSIWKTVEEALCCYFMLCYTKVIKNSKKELGNSLGFNLN